VPGDERLVTRLEVGKHGLGKDHGIGEIGFTQRDRIDLVRRVAHPIEAGVGEQQVVCERPGGEASVQREAVADDAVETERGGRGGGRVGAGIIGQGVSRHSRRAIAVLLQNAGRNTPVGAKVVDQPSAPGSGDVIIAAIGLTETDLFRIGRARKANAAGDRERAGVTQVDVVVAAAIELDASVLRQPEVERETEQRSLQATELHVTLAPVGERIQSITEALTLANGGAQRVTDINGRERGALCRITHRDASIRLGRGAFQNVVEGTGRAGRPEDGAGQAIQDFDAIELLYRVIRRGRDIHAVDQRVLHDTRLQAARLRTDVFSLHGGQVTEHFPHTLQLLDDTQAGGHDIEGVRQIHHSPGSQGTDLDVLGSVIRRAITDNVDFVERTVVCSGYGERRGDGERRDEKSRGRTSRVVFHRKITRYILWYIAVV
jgi:hypothetical protein